MSINNNIYCSFLRSFAKKHLRFLELLSDSGEPQKQSLKNTGTKVWAGMNGEQEYFLHCDCL